MLTLALLLLQAAPACPPVDRVRLMALDFEAFDQDLTGGWRLLEAAECDAQAADLIRDWSAAHPEIGTSQRGGLVWHEGQMRGMAGQTAAALTLFSRSYRKPADDWMGWNHYVDGSIAFLRRDRAGLAAARARLAALPRPADFAPVGPDGKPRAVSWPLNLDVLDRLRDGWGQGYKAAYRCGAKARKDRPNQLCN